MAVIRNTNTKIIHCLPDYSDRELVGRAAGLNEEQIKELAKLEKGVAVIRQSDWLDSVLCKVEKYQKSEFEIKTIKKETVIPEYKSMILKALLVDGDMELLKKNQKNIIYSDLNGAAKASYLDLFLDSYSSDDVIVQLIYHIYSIDRIMNKLKKFNKTEMEIAETIAELFETYLLNPLARKELTHQLIEKQKQLEKITFSE